MIIEHQFFNRDSRLKVVRREDNTVTVFVNEDEIDFSRAEFTQVLKCLTYADVYLMKEIQEDDE